MRFKADENLHPEVASWLNSHGHDAATVWDQGLRGKCDRDIAGLLRAEKRAFLTLDTGFADIRTYPPQDYSGLIVLRLTWQSRRHVLAFLPRIQDLVGRERLDGKLWVVDEQSIRIRGAEQDEPAT